MRHFFVKALLASVVAIPVFVIPVIEPASAPMRLTTDEKIAVYTRCKKAGGSGKACCAAADGTWKPDPKGGGTCTLNKGTGAQIFTGPTEMMVAPQ